MVEPQPSKLVVRVRFPSPAPVSRAILPSGKSDRRAQTLRAERVVSRRADTRQHRRVRYGTDGSREFQVRNSRTRLILVTRGCALARHSHTDDRCGAARGAAAGAGVQQRPASQAGFRCRAHPLPRREALWAEGRHPAHGAAEEEASHPAVAGHGDAAVLQIRSYP